MRDRVFEMEYVFHDTGHELPETYQYLDDLQRILGKDKPIVNTNRDLFDPAHEAMTPPIEEEMTPFKHWLEMYGGMIPSNHRRWCTRKLKLKPLEDYVGDEPVINYVGLRADEKHRTGYISHKPNIKPVYPFIEDGLVKEDIIRILEESGLGLPSYLDWGRTRSGCTFCFYQQKIEWVRLKQYHPDKFEEAKRYEEQSVLHGEEFYWCQTEPLSELEKPKRMAEIEENWEKRRQWRKANKPNKTLVEVLGGMEVEEEEREGCLICFL